MENQSEKLTITGAEDGECVSMGGGTYRVVIGGKQTNGTYAIIDMLIPPNGGPGPHAHTDVQESFFVMEGEIEVKTEEKHYTAGKGTFVNIPLGGMVHCFKNKTDTLTRLWCMLSPAGMEDMFLELGTPVQFGEFLPPVPMTPELMEKMKAASAKYGQVLFPPDYLDK